MKNKKVKIFISIIIFIIIIVVIILLINGIKSNSSNKVINDNRIGINQKIDNFLFENASLKYKNKLSTFETNVTNIGNDTEYLTEVKIHIKDKKNKEIMILTGFVGDNIKSGESKIITSTYGQKLNDAYSVEYEIIK